MVISNEVRLFLVFCISGTLIGIFFDIFRIIRRSFKISELHTYIEDILFGIITGVFLIFVIFIYNDGNIRLFMFIALIMGLLLYLLTISKYFIKISVFILTTMKNMVIKLLKLIYYPIKQLLRFLAKIFNKPFMAFIINIKKAGKIFILKNDKKYKKNC